MRAWSFAIVLLALSAPAAMAADCFTPSPDEVALYQSIAKRLASAPPTSDPVPLAVGQAEIDWALALELRVSGGGTPTAAETARYEDIARRLQATQPRGETGPAVTQAEIDWALALEARVKGSVCPGG